MAALGDDAVVDDVDGDAGIQVAQHIQIDVHVGADLDNILLAHLGAVGIFDQGHGAVQLAQIQNIVDVHAVAGGDVVQDDAVFNVSDFHTLFNFQIFDGERSATSPRT